MCLYPRFIKNPAYSKQKYLQIGTTQDIRKKYIPIGCGECFECRKQKAQQWRVRLAEEIKVNKYSYFVTLTFSNESLIELSKKIKCKEQDSNAVATIAVRLFLERWRRKHKKTLKHWFITELGHENTERIHIHGIIFTEFEISNEYLNKYWQYGRSDTGQYCNLQTINYIVKYVTKIDTEHKNFKALIICSAGIGESFIKTETAKNTYRYKKGNTPEYYTLNNGQKVALPIYYRNKLYSEKERADMWTDRLDKATIYVNGIKIRKINTDAGEKQYFDILKSQQEWNKDIGYGDTSKEWQKESYNITLKMLQKAKKV